MKTKKILAALGILFLSALSSGIHAQFEGQITMNLYSQEKGDTKVSEMNIYVTSDRIFMKGEEELNFGNSFNTGGMLIRNDKKDFLVLMEGNDALQVKKSEVEGLFKMFSSWSGGSNNSSSSNDQFEYEYTDRKKKVMGYESYELLITDSKNDVKMSVWLTPNIDINWGMLAEPWNNLPIDADKAARVSRDAIFTGKNFPMMIEVEGKKGVEKVMEVSSINKSTIAKAMVEIPTGVNIIGVTELMFKMMSGN